MLRHDLIGKGLRVDPVSGGSSSWLLGGSGELAPCARASVLARPQSAISASRFAVFMMLVPLLDLTVRYRYNLKLI